MGGGGTFGPVIQGLMGGVASQIGAKFLPGYGATLGLGAAGYFTRNQTLMTLTGMQAANLLPLGGLLGGGSSNTSGGFL